MLELEPWWWARSFTYVGRLHVDKGVDRVVEAWLVLERRYGQQCPPLWLIGGDPSEIRQLRERCGQPERLDHLESAGRLHWWGYLDEAGISAVLLRSAALVTHSRYEPGGRVILEAMAEGVPAIATPHGFAQELVVDWQTGFLVDFGDVEGLIRRMEHFVRQPLLACSLGARARRAALQALDTWAFLDRHCEIYDQVHARAAGSLPLETMHRAASTRRDAAPWTRLPFDGEPETDIDAVETFLAKHLSQKPGRVREQIGLPGRSRIWLADSPDRRRWIIKWPCPAIATTPLHDPQRAGCRSYTSRWRYEADVRAADLPGFLPLEGHDPGSRLLMRSLGRPLPVSADPATLREAAGALARLHRGCTLDLDEIQALIDRNWHEARDDEVEHTLKALHAWRVQHEPAWPGGRYPGLRLAWRAHRLSLQRGLVRVPESLDASQSGEWSALCAPAALESGRPTVICHGTPDLSHCIRDPSGRVALIDGEKAQPGQPESDLAELLVCLVDTEATDQPSAGLWEHLIGAVSEGPEERLLTLSWCAVMALEHMVREVTFGRPERADRWHDHWIALACLAKAWS